MFIWLCTISNDENKIICQKWDSNPRPQKWTATWTQRLRPLGHPDMYILGPVTWIYHFNMMILINIDISISKNEKKNLPRRGIEPRPPRWERGILTTRLPGNLNIGNGNNIWSMVLQYNRWMWVFDVLTWLIIEIVDEQINVYCSRIFIYIFATVPEASVA